MSCDEKLNKEILAALKKADEEGGFGFYSASFSPSTKWDRHRKVILESHGKCGELETAFYRATAALLTRNALLYCRDNLGEEAWKKLGIEIPKESESEFPYAAVKNNKNDNPSTIGEVRLVTGPHVGLFEGVDMSNGLWIAIDKLTKIKNQPAALHILAECEPAEFAAMTNEAVNAKLREFWGQATSELRGARISGTPFSDWGSGVNKALSDAVNILDRIFNEMIGKL